MITILMSSFAIALLIGLPVAFIMGVSGLSALYLGDQFPLEVLPQRLFNGINSFPLMAVPFFILASELMSAARISASLLTFCNALVGHIRGGLGQVNVLVSMFFAGISGSALADAAGPSAIVMNMMRKSGYTTEYAAGLSAATSTIGPIIPPSIIMVIYAVTAGNVTVAGLFLAGIVPGLLLGGVLALTNYLMCLKQKQNINQYFSWRRAVKSFFNAIPALLMPALILGGILSGAFTATEAGAIAVFYALFIGMFVSRSIKVSHLPRILLRSGVITSAVLLVVSMSAIFAWLLTILQVPMALSALMDGLHVGPVAALLLMALIVLISGLFIDTLPAVIILVPVLSPVATQFGIDPLHFAMMLVLNLTIGMITPPVGPVLFVVSTVGRIKLETVSRAVLPFLLAELGTLLLIILIPEISTTVPHLFGFMR
ncbi:TRAP transporter large permease [Pokkaliibacter plantistimulans]|uniref:TRAP transporter large permease protein n=1 Tax=Proteobacteria bacterium 228 TaxID=2083153 RepID=A0A2S5KGP9_9PROT|nr:TRAP transporter large permease [Pokkaliibacter plantistimulans]PPC73958.1 TRAP transporter large permease [Pokkaliibacter plantistimulans]